jgi:hypothetical protein
MTRTGHVVGPVSGSVLAVGAELVAKIAVLGISSVTGIFADFFEIELLVNFFSGLGLANVPGRTTPLVGWQADFKADKSS